MAKRVIEGLSLLGRPPRAEFEPKAPIVPLSDGLVLDWNIMQSPTLILGSVGSGKTFLLSEIMDHVLEYVERLHHNAVIFCVKEDLLRYAKEGDIVISLAGTDPACCWNVFSEMRASKYPEITAREIAKILFREQESSTMPFFVDAARDILAQSMICMYNDGLDYGLHYSNAELIEFLERTPMHRRDETELPDWHELAVDYPEYFRHVEDYLGNDLGQGYACLSEIRTLIASIFGSFRKAGGTFSAISALKEGKKIFLCYDQVNASESAHRIYSCILELLFRHACDKDNGRETWFFIDEGSLLPRSQALIDAMSLGREHGFRLFMCLQSAQLMTRHHQGHEAKALLSLFPNLIIMRVQDSMSRQLLADRYGKALYSYSYTSPMQKIVQSERERSVVSDEDFAPLFKQGNAIFSLPALSPSPFYYNGYRKELEKA